MQILINLTPASSMFLQCPVIVTYCFNVLFCCFNVFSSDNCLRFVFFFCNSTDSSCQTKWKISQTTPQVICCKGNLFFGSVGLLYMSIQILVPVLLIISKNGKFKVLLNIIIVNSD